MIKHYEKWEVGYIKSCLLSEKEADYKMMAKNLHRTPKQIANKVSDMRYTENYKYKHKPYEEWEIEYIEYCLFTKENISLKNMSIFLNRTVNSVKSKIARIRKEKNVGYIHKKYEEWEIEYLKKNYPIKSTKILSAHLQRQETEIRRKANALKLSKQSQLNNYDKEIREFAKKGFSRARISRELGKSRSAISHYIKKNNIECRYETSEEKGSYFRALEDMRIADVIRKSKKREEGEKYWD